MKLSREQVRFMRKCPVTLNLASLFTSRPMRTLCRTGFLSIQRLIVDSGDAYEVDLTPAGRK